MKIKLIHSTAATVAALVMTLAFASASTLSTPQPQSALNLVKATAGGFSLSISNAGDQAWILQSSSNFSTWTEVESLQVYNGSFQRRYTNGAAGNLFYRVYYDAARQTNARTTANALVLPATSYNYAAPVLPASFSANPILAEDNMPANNLTTDAGATLGRALFYDKRLSTNQTVSCASCHQQAHGFADPRPVSVGFNGRLGSRNAMGLSNARWYQRKSFFWDERAVTLEDQTLQPVQDPIEMGMTLAALTNRLASEPFYTNLFAKAFGSTAITTNRISAALAQFVRSIVSTASKYDVGVTNNFTNFTASENLGRQIFFGLPGAPRATCAACHGTDNFVPTTGLNNNGLEFPYTDLGVGGVTGATNQNGMFKAPSLRNIELTAPYMHDGRLATLEQVVDFYDSGVVANPNLSPPLLGRNGTPLRLNLTSDQKAALVAFLKTLTDPALATDTKWSDPFNYGN